MSAKTESAGRFLNRKLWSGMIVQDDDILIGRFMVGKTAERFLDVVEELDGEVILDEMTNDIRQGRSYRVRKIVARVPDPSDKTKPYPKREKVSGAARRKPYACQECSKEIWEYPKVWREFNGKTAKLCADCQKKLNPEMTDEEYETITKSLKKAS